MTIAQVAASARRSLGPYCESECRALCCSKGILPIDAKSQPRFGNPGSFIVLDNGCPHLFASKCRIYQNRPSACREYPIWVRGNTVTLSTGCPGVQSGKFYAHERQLLRLGATVLRQ
ncbi:hypothetical protein COY28_01275 [Candidatus Woesearchaeota archaeon CG_4_10_14_0_2_um_filter_57_5]|nr:MAG: hypothetical protein AUJ68_06985 [Candidatus Woesearchaeota archaeon CG1_02_57_44]PIN70858.1 MAG: hypothetical protein COV94_00935 [Candidatus Woesearchaeota archaeon CG11_big_fil_rev_8_21_14_0_20_57_5]PIZ56077.1 MAG: hypothetical protein COY28_01275 [Candidatus Woesearchaeota archaeon CG_4_10_14_0_2_um_filter_57_5]